MSAHAQPLIRVVRTRDGSLTYLIATAPETLPPVRSGDLTASWEAAREAAVGAEWGHPRLFRFERDDGSTHDMVLADEDACCWAAAVDHVTCMQTAYGLSLCLRLLALVDLLARAPWARPHCRIGRAGAALDPALVRMAATLPLTDQAGFDESLFRLRLGGSASPPRNRLTASGAQA